MTFEWLTDLPFVDVLAQIAIAAVGWAMVIGVLAGVPIFIVRHDTKFFPPDSP